MRRCANPVRAPVGRAHQGLGAVVSSLVNRNYHVKHAKVAGTTVTTVLACLQSPASMHKSDLAFCDVHGPMAAPGTLQELARTHVEVLGKGTGFRVYIYLGFTAPTRRPAKFQVRGCAYPVRQVRMETMMLSSLIVLGLSLKTLVPM